MAGTRHPTDWEQQREQLSAYLDGELTPPERDALARHISACPECTAELARLRGVRALLGALPTPAVPRSFALPATTPGPNASPPPPPSPTGPRTAAPARPAWYRASQWAGGIAASIGLFLLLGSALLGAGGPHSLGTSRVSAPYAGASAAQGTHTPMEARENPTVGVPPGTPAATQPSTISPAPPPIESGPPVVPITGAGLLAGGIALAVAGRVARRQR